MLSPDVVLPVTSIAGLVVLMAGAYWRNPVVTIFGLAVLIVPYAVQLLGMW